MKIQCPCGTKVVIEVTPEQAREGVQFVCPVCGADSSALVTQIVRQQFGISAEAASAPAPEIAPPPAPRPVPIISTPAPVPVPVAKPVPVAAVPPQPVPVARVRLQRSEGAAVEPAAAGSAPLCKKHPGVETTEACVVCHKPICPKCMELFGYVCSPLCRQKADLQGIAVPVCAAQKSVVEARQWRKVVMVAGSVSAVVLVLLGFWFWYAWFGVKPRIAFAQRFEKPAYSGESYLGGADKSQLIFLHGGKLARYDTKSKQEVWSAELIDQQDIAKKVKEETRRLQELQGKLNDNAPDAPPIKILPPDKMAKEMERWAAADLDLQVVGQNIWVATEEKVVRYDWDTGKPGEQLAVKGGFGGLIQRGDEFLRLDRDATKDVITHINLATGKITEETIIQPLLARAGTNAGTARTVAAAAKGGKAGGAGIPLGKPGQDMNRPLDARKVEEQYAQMSLPQRLAAPATLSINRAQERTLAELNSDAKIPGGGPDNPELAEYFTLIPAKDGYVQFASRLIEKRLVARQVMKPRPGKSALDGPVNVTQSAEVANEIFNEMARDRGGDTEMEDQSRYLITLRRADGKGDAEWKGEVIGPPAVFPLASVNVIASRQKITVLDKANKKLWESALTYNVAGRSHEDDPATTGQGPCVERGDTLFVFDEGVLTAFDIKTGNAQWRLPSVGISGLFFDDKGMLYVDSTTASPDTIKYSRQIDVASRTSDLMIKIDPRTGKTLWSKETHGAIAYVSGDYIYSVQRHGELRDEEDESPYGAPAVMAIPNFYRIRRINPRNGKEMWAHYEERAPLDIRFDKNRVHIVFKKEVQVLSCWSF